MGWRESPAYHSEIDLVRASVGEEGLADAGDGVLGSRPHAVPPPTMGRHQSPGDRVTDGGSRHAAAAFRRSSTARLDGGDAEAASMGGGVVKKS